MTVDSECTHDLPFREKMFASKGKGRTCPRCGASIFVQLPVLNSILGASPLLMAVLLAFAWTDGGILWFWFAAGIAIHVIIFAAELKHRTPQQYDHEEYHKHTKRNFALLAVILISIGLLLYIVI